VYVVRLAKVSVSCVNVCHSSYIIVCCSGCVCCSTYCSDHRPRQSMPSSPSKLCRMSPTCAVCMCDVDTLSPSDDVLLVPCCQHVLLHRDCLQVEHLVFVTTSV